MLSPISLNSGTYQPMATPSAVFGNSALRETHSKNSNSQDVPTSVKYKRLIAPLLELSTAVTFLLNVPWIKSKSQQLISTTVNKNVISSSAAGSREAVWLKRLATLSNPRLSNMLLVASVLFRAVFNSSVGVNQQQAGMVLTNVGAVLFNIPILLLMTLSSKKEAATAVRYSKMLALLNLLLSGLFATGFVQKANHDIGRVHYNHDMRHLLLVTDLHNHLPLKERLQRGGQELKSLTIDSAKGYQFAWQDMRRSFSSLPSFKTFANPLDVDGTPGRIAFSAFTMPLGALMALLNKNGNRRIAMAAAMVSILGNVENGLALALSAWLDKDQPFRLLGVVGGLMSPISEGILTSKHATGPAAMTTSNAFQNLYQSTAWAHPSEMPSDPANPEKKILLNQV